MAPGLPAALSIDQREFDRAVAETEWILAEEVARQTQEAEDQYKKEFRPYVWTRFGYGSPRPNTLAVLGGVYAATCSFVSRTCSASSTTEERGLRSLIQTHYRRWGPSMPIYGQIIGYFTVIEPAPEAGSDLAVPRDSEGSVVGDVCSIERPQFLVTRKLSDPLSSWINALDQQFRSRV